MWRLLPFRTAVRVSFRRCGFATIPLPAAQCTSTMTAIDKLHQVIENYRQINFPQTMPSVFVEQVLYAADENKDGRISVDEMNVMLRNLYSLQPITRDEVLFIMERDLGMEPQTDSVPMEKVKQLLLEIYH